MPSVIHWRQNHYAAILEQQEGLYLVSDPTFGESKFIPAEVINEEASDVFLVPTAMRKSDWTELDKTEGQMIHGKGLPNTVRDGQDKGCRHNFAGKIECPPCKGAPVWWVTEPFINVFIADEPMSYLTSRGEPFTFRLTYKQRDTRPDSYIGLTGWNHSWYSHAHVESRSMCQNPSGCGTSMPNPIGGPGFDTTVYLPDGGEIFYSASQKYDQETRNAIAAHRYYVGGEFR